jgi:hypothetical protein
MATKTGFKQTAKPSPYRGGGTPSDNVVVDKPPSDDTFYVVVVVAFLAAFLVFMPVMGWVLKRYEEQKIKMEAKAKEQDAKIERLLKLLEKK